MDYVRGIHSWRGGVQMYGDWYHANLNNNYLGTYIIQQPRRPTRPARRCSTRAASAIPTWTSSTRASACTFRTTSAIKKGLTLSPGVRYSYQTRVDDPAAFEPRLGITWAPTQERQDDAARERRDFPWLAGPGHLVADRALRQQHQRDIIITNPSYPDPGSGGVVPPANTYRLGDYKLNKNVRYSAGIDQRFSPRAGVNVLYNYYHQDQLPRGTNLNPLVNGVRPDPAFAQHHLDGHRRGDHPARALRQLQCQSGRARRRRPTARRSTGGGLALNGGYSYIRARRNAMGPFDVPASGTLDTEWGHGPADNPYRVNVGDDQHAVEERSTVSLSLNASDGYPLHADDRVRRQPATGC